MGEPEHKVQRRHKRVAAREVTAVVELDGQVTPFTVVNLSIGGALVTGTRSMPKGESHDFELKLKGTKAVTVRGQVVNLRDQGMGIAFESLDSSHLGAMEKLIAAVEAQASQPPPLPPRSKGGDDLPPAAPRAEDGIFDTHDPRPPRGGAPDEREEYLRALVKNRDEALRRGRVALAALTVEADGLRSAAGRLKARLDTANSQQALTEVALQAARNELEAARDAQRAERETANEQLELEQRRTLEAIGTVSAIEAKLRRHEMESKRMLEEAEAARREAASNAADVASLRRAREELLQANRKAMEAQAQLKRERDAKVLADKTHAETAARAQALEAEVSKLKAKLIAAENALERAAARKAPAAGQQQQRGSPAK
ncbi:MAG: PilZ domain-containing protein [Myxococcaceae bacterium]|nr:PilZ domain-containing protein [Myxococcaceae bacterium]